MTASSTIEVRPETSVSANKNNRRDSVPNVVVYVDPEHDPKAMIGHARTVAVALGANLLLVRVIEPPEAGIAAVDPVDWDIRVREASRQLADLAKAFPTEDCKISVKVLEGHPAEQICGCVAGKPDDILVVPSAPGAGRWPVSEAACGAVASDVAAILAVSTQSVGKPTQAYRRVFVPLDGSANAESAIPKAAALAAAYGGELLLCHVVPEPVLTEVGPERSETLKLKDEIARHNQRVGESYLGRVKDGLKDCGVPVSTRLLTDGDARRSLVKAIEREAADIVVAASHGRSGHADVATGDVAAFILDRSSVPVLVTRESQGRRDEHIFHDLRHEGVRHPADLEP